MLITEKTIIKWHYTTKEYFENLGYIFTKYKDNFIVDINDLNISNNVKIIIKCDYCGKEFSRVYNRYTIDKQNHPDGKDACLDCRYIKSGENKRFPYEEVKYYIEIESGSGCKLLSTEYKNYSTKLKIRCSCGNVFKTTFRAFTSERKMQCNQCGINKRRGAGNPNWNGGTTDKKNLIRKSQEYKDWRIGVLEKDEYTCQCCGTSSGANLNAHHYENFSENEELRFDIDNGITLCEYCHDMRKYGSFHHIYGTRNNTQEQLMEYIDRYKNGEFDELRSKNKN